MHINVDACTCGYPTFHCMLPAQLSCRPAAGGVAGRQVAPVHVPRQPRLQGGQLPRVPRRAPAHAGDGRDGVMGVRKGAFAVNRVFVPGSRRPTDGKDFVDNLASKNTKFFCKSEKKATKKGGFGCYSESYGFSTKFENFKNNNNAPQIILPSLVPGLQAKK